MLVPMRRFRVTYVAGEVSGIGAHRPEEEIDCTDFASDIRGFQFSNVVDRGLVWIAKSEVRRVEEVKLPAPVLVENGVKEHPLKESPTVLVVEGDYHESK